MINGLNCLLHHANEGLGFFLEEKTGGEKTVSKLRLHSLSSFFFNCSLTEKIPVNQKLIILKKERKKKEEILRSAANIRTLS